VRARILKT